MFIVEIYKLKQKRKIKITHLNFHLKKLTFCYLSFESFFYVQMHTFYKPVFVL